MITMTLGLAAAKEAKQINVTRKTVIFFIRSRVRGFGALAACRAGTGPDKMVGRSFRLMAYIITNLPSLRSAQADKCVGEATIGLLIHPRQTVQDALAVTLVVGIERAYPFLDEFRDMYFRGAGRRAVHGWQHDVRQLPGQFQLVRAHSPALGDRPFKQMRAPAVALGRTHTGLREATEMSERNRAGPRRACTGSHHAGSCAEWGRWFSSEVSSLHLIHHVVCGPPGQGHDSQGWVLIGIRTE